MTDRTIRKLIHVGKYVSEVEVIVRDTETGWSPSISLEDAYRLDDIRAALAEGDLARAAQYSTVYLLTPVAV